MLNCTGVIIVSSLEIRSTSIVTSVEIRFTSIVTSVEIRFTSIVTSSQILFNMIDARESRGRRFGRTVYSSVSMFVINGTSKALRTSKAIFNVKRLLGFENLRDISNKHIE